eukprot:COSAG05_NODE_7557_length_797_cov_0.899713_1_plen_90_part_10
MELTLDYATRQDKELQDGMDINDAELLYANALLQPDSPGNEAEAAADAGTEAAMAAMAARLSEQRRQQQEEQQAGHIPNTQKVGSTERAR